MVFMVVFILFKRAMKKRDKAARGNARASKCL